MSAGFTSTRRCRPACAPGECLLRCTLMATHTKALVDEAVDIIADVLHQYDL